MKLSSSQVKERLSKLILFTETLIFEGSLAFSFLFVEAIVTFTDLEMLLYLNFLLIFVFQYRIKFIEA